MMCTMRRTRFLVALVAVLAAAGLAACGGDGRDGASGSPDAVVARVHGRAVHQSAVDLARAEARFSGDAGEALDVAVDRELVRAERSEEHTSELQSRFDLVCRLLLEKKK